ncbi:MAG TPA: YbgC/FadM family acyl-CoA thioesterase [Gammaproteobacteria bacterium]|nr:YbgC/FadM family acyl-CoA thioesterase [Gammaproteobacteria bacterium]
MTQHSSFFKIYYEDIDIGGIVYHANYLKFMERGRTDFLHRCGFDLHTLLIQEGVQFAVKDLQITFIKSAKLGDEIIVLTELTELSGAKLIFNQQIATKKADDLTTLCTGKIVVVCLDRYLKLIRLPSRLKEELYRASRHFVI